MRTIWSVVSVSFAESCDRPLASPKAKPMLPPIRKPIEARQNETQMLRASSPESSSFHAGERDVARRRQHARRHEAGDAGELPDRDDGERHDPPHQAARARQADPARKRNTVDEAHDCDASLEGR
ncbi:hypothetical protein ACVJDU_008372 [Bradyrhizobium diazoefficiens]